MTVVSTSEFFYFLVFVAKTLIIWDVGSCLLKHLDFLHRLTEFNHKFLRKAVLISVMPFYLKSSGG